MNFTIFLWFIKEFCRQSTIQGLSHIVAPKRHFAERLLWVVVVLFAGLFATGLVLRSYRRYETNPTVIAMDKNYMEWKTPLPTATFCFNDRLDDEKASELIKRTWDTQDNGTLRYYMDFLKCLTRGYYNVNGSSSECTGFSNDPNLADVDLAQLSEQVNFQASHVSVVPFSGEELGYHQTLIEGGLCYSTNLSFLTHFFNSGLMNQTAPVPLTCSYFKPMCYAKVMRLTREVKFYVHSADDIPKVSGALLTRFDMDSYADFLSLTIEANPSIRALRPSQRQCLFFDEKPQGEVPYYTYNLCLMECRRALSMKLCGCVGYNYKKRGGQPQCKTQDLQCLLKSSDLLESLRLPNKKRYNCNCMPECTSITYYKTSTESLRGYSAGKDIPPETAFRYGLESMPRTKLIRDILYSAEDLLVSWGGIIGLFLGCSVLSAVEVFYFFTIRALRYMLCSTKLPREEIRKRSRRDWLRPYVIKHAGGRILHD